MNRNYKVITALVIAVLIAMMMSVGEWAQWTMLTNAATVETSAAGISSDDVTLNNGQPGAADAPRTGPSGAGGERGRPETGAPGRAPAQAVRANIETRQEQAAGRELRIKPAAGPERRSEEKLLGETREADPAPQHSASLPAHTPETRPAREQERGREFGRKQNADADAATAAESTLRKADQPMQQKKARSAVAKRGQAQALIAELAKSKSRKEAMARLAAFRKTTR